MNRVRAAALHFCVSCLIGAGLLLLIWFVVYPPPMLFAIGGHEIVLLILGVDVVLGPLLTLVVFDTRKRTLMLDLAVIVVLQISAMVFGVSVLYEARPVYVAAVGDEFQVVQATEVTEENLAESRTEFPLLRPRWVGTVAPTTSLLIDAVDMVRQVGGGRGHFPQLHIPYESMAKEVLAKSRPTSDLISHNGAKADEVRSWLKSHGHDDRSARYQPIKISGSEFVVILDGKTGAVVGIAPFKP